MGLNGTPARALPFAFGHTVAFAALGCRTNQEEIALLSSQFLQRGWSIVDDVSRADAIIVNTCTVTAKTESKARRLIRGLAKSFPQARICVTGCLAQQSPDSFPGVAIVAGNAIKNSIVKLLEDNLEGVFHSDLMGHERVLEISGSIPSSLDTHRTRYSLKIQEGCNNQCAYCIVPSVRGPSISADPQHIVSAVRKAVDKGYKEIVLTGTHIGQYQQTGCGCLSDLLREIDTTAGDVRWRLSSLDPRDLTDDLIDLFRTIPRLCDHLHLSVQSLSDDVLRAMGRGDVAVDEIRRRIDAVVSLRPQLTVGYDFIVGFPGESDAQFSQTMTVLAMMPVAYAHIFRYSRRPGTTAARAPHQVPEKEKTQRSIILRDEVLRRRISYINGYRGAVMRVLSEEGSTGLTSNFLRLAIPDPTLERNRYIDMKITGYDPALDGARGDVLRMSAGKHPTCSRPIAAGKCIP